MYKCQRCNFQSRPGHTEEKVITHVRDVKYVFNNKKGVKESIGTEIVKELTVCRRCKRQLSQQQPLSMQEKTVRNNN